MPERTAERPTSLVETHKGYDPRIIFFYPAICVLLLVLAGGLAYQQVFRSDLYHEREKQQNQRRVLVPGPRGNIFDRQGLLLVGNRPRFSVTLFLDQLRREILTEYRQVRKNYRELGDKDIPNARQLEQIARFSVVQRYLDQINVALGRTEKVSGPELERHFRQQLLLPYILLNDLTAEEYAKLLEQLPVASPLQVYASSVRYYPHGSAAAHTLGYVGQAEEPEPTDFAGADLPTFAMKGLTGRAGVEAKFDANLKGNTGGSIYRVDPGGYKVNPPLQKKLPVPGHDIVTSLDIQLQKAAESALADQTGAAVAVDVSTGEVLVLASKPDYDLNLFTPRLSIAASAEIDERGAWLNRSMQGGHPPGSTFKILTTIAGLRSGSIAPDFPADCSGSMTIAGGKFTCDNGHANHGSITLRTAIAKSCDIYFYTYGVQTTVDVIAAEARRFGFDRQTGIELPAETRPFVPDPAWKMRARAERWFPGNTAHMSIGQGYVLTTPLQMACFAASVARGETLTKPTLIHDPRRLMQRTEPIGLTREQYAALIEGMEGCTLPGGTAERLSTDPLLRLPGVRVAGKTGTAQVPGKLNVAWFICFAPVERPEIAIAVMVEGDTPNETFGGGKYAVPVASAILKSYFARKNGTQPPAPLAFRENH